MLREQSIEEDEIDLSNVVMSHYQLSKIRDTENGGVYSDEFELPPARMRDEVMRRFQGVVRDWW